MYIKEHHRGSSLTIGDLICGIIVCLISAWYVLPKVKYTIPPIYIVLLGLLLIVLIGMKNTKWLSNLVVLAVSVLALSFLYFVYTFAHDTNKAIGIITQLFLSSLPAIVLFSLSQHKRILKPIFIILGVMVLFVAVKTGIEMLANPRIARILAYGKSDEYDLMSYRMRNIGGYGHAYGISFLSIAFMYKLFAEKSKKKFLLIILIAGCFWYLIKAEYFLAILLVSVSLFLIAASKSKKQGTQIILFVALIVVLFIPNILEFIAINIPASSISQKLYEIVNLLKFGHISGTASAARADVYLQSIQQFVKSPIWGTKSSTVMYETIGGHSTILDFMGLSGLIGLGAYIGVLYFTKRTITQTFFQFNITSQSCYSIVFLLYIVLSILNPTMSAYELSFFVFLFIPLFIIATSKYTIQKPVYATAQYSSLN